MVVCGNSHLVKFICFFLKEIKVYSSFLLTSEENMNRQELVRNLAKKFELPIGKTNEIVTELLATITKSLTKGDTITFVGFGSFSTKKRAGRIGRNPQNGKPVKIPPRKVVRFSVGKALKESVNKK